MHRRKKNQKTLKIIPKARIRADHRISPGIPLCLDGHHNGIVLQCPNVAPTPTQEVSLSVLLDIPVSVLGGSYDLPKSILSNESFRFVLTQNNAVLHARVVVVASIP